MSLPCQLEFYVYSPPYWFCHQALPCIWALQRLQRTVSSAGRSGSGSRPRTTKTAERDKWIMDDACDILLKSAFDRIWQDLVPSVFCFCCRTHIPIGKLLAWAIQIFSLLWACFRIATKIKFRAAWMVLAGLRWRHLKTWQKPHNTCCTLECSLPRVLLVVGAKPRGIVTPIK